VNTGLGDAHWAAEEVEYVNGPAASRLGQLRAANGHTAPYGVKIWGIGNEMYGPWQWGHMQITQYPDKHNLVVRAKRKVDPTIKVIASSATPEETTWCYIENRQFSTFAGRENVSDKLPFAFGSNQDWTGALLAKSADYIDYLGEHFYGYPNLAIDLEKEQFVDANDSLTDKVRRLSNKVQYKFEAWEEYLKRMPALKNKDIKFALDEWSPRNRSVNPGAPPTAGNPMLNAMTNALVYHEFFRHSDMVGLGVATGGMRQATDASVVNPTETTQDCDLNLTGGQPSGAVKLRQLTVPAGAAAAAPAPGPGGFSGPPAAMAESSSSSAEMPGLM